MSTIRQVKGFEAIKGVVLEPLPFDVERNLVTPTFKLKRPQLLAYYKVRNILLTCFVMLTLLLRMILTLSFIYIFPFHSINSADSSACLRCVQEKIDALYANQKK